MEIKKTIVTFNKSFATDLPEDVVIYFAENIPQECVALFRMTCKTFKIKLKNRDWGMPYKYALKSLVNLKLLGDSNGMAEFNYRCYCSLVCN